MSGGPETKRAEKHTRGAEIVGAVGVASVPSRIRWVLGRDPLARLLVAVITLGAVVLISLSDNARVHDIVFRVLLWATITSAWNIIGGFGGQLSLGHAAFYGLGSYSAVLLFIRAGVTPLLGALVGVLLAVALGFLVGLAGLRLRGPFFALATFVMGIAFAVSATNLAGLTGGSFGLPLPVRGEWYELIFATRRPYVGIMLGLFLLTMGLVFWLRHSRLGIYLIASRSDLDAARSFGINVLWVRLVGNCVSAALTALAGAVAAFYLLFVDPQNAFGFIVSVRMVLVTLIGGIGTIGGPVLGALVVIPIDQLLADYVAAVARGLNLIILGLVIMVIVVAAPSGLWGGIEQLRAKFGGRRR